MPMPYQFRDYPIAIYMAMVLLVGGVWSLCVGDLQLVEVALAEGCCEKQSCPTVKSLAALPFASDVHHHPREGTHLISLRADADVSAQQIWDALEKIDRRPARLIVNKHEFVARPTH